MNTINVLCYALKIVENANIFVIFYHNLCKEFIKGKYL